MHSNEILDKEDTGPKSASENARPDGGRFPQAPGLTTFQVDCLRAIEYCIEEDPDVEGVPYGLQIMRVLREYRGEGINNGRLYPNLDKLVGEDLVAKSELDKRTNGYQLTDAAVALLDDRVSWLGGER